MKTKPWKTYTFWVLLAEVVGGLSGWLSREGFQHYGEAVRQPPLNPPAWVFPVVWTVLYALMGIGAARVRLSPPSQARNKAINLFLTQLTVNFFWPLIFFNAGAYGFAFFWLIILWLLILAMIFFFRRADKPAALLQLPYALWVTFAAYLNLGVWLLNG